MSKKKCPQRAPKKNYFVDLCKTEEGRQLRKEWSNKPRKNAGRPAGVPHGYTKETISPLREKAKIEAEKVVSIMSKDDKDLAENGYAQEALKTAVEVMRVPGETRERLSAARLVLDFTKQKPASRSDVTLGKAEDFLANLLEEEQSGKQKATDENTKATLQ